MQQWFTVVSSSVAQEHHTSPGTMESTSPARSIYTQHFLLIAASLLASPGTSEAVTPVSSLHISTLLRESNLTSTCKFETHDLKFVDYQTKNLSLLVTGNNEKEVTLMFHIEVDILKQIPNITLNPGEKNESYSLVLEATSVGHTVVVVNASPVNMTDVSDAFVRVSVSHSEDLDYFSDVVGWIYFTAWSVSFYPQTYSNWRRKSVIGLHFDYLSLNIVGFFLYSVFNVCLYWTAAIQDQYFHRHPFGVNPVQLNDVLFSLHAFFACSIQVFQCCVYERGDQQISKTAKTILAAVILLSLVMVIVSSAAAVQWLDFLYFVSYVKLFITLIKYIPQAYYNYRRKSTSGWSIGNILLDFTGGTLSVAQMFIIAYNYNDWGSIFGDPTKFGLGLFSVIFDIFFMIQHYVLYRGNEGYQRDLNSPQPTHSSSLTESVSSVDYGAIGNIH
ncbi:cystinosin homolog [Homarus americanus]|uniref:cystinosin homolog n=1 Tax=Homarus americanus TaxID=6706 RepID=UPI001C440D94|nr:cystinosin homolog [Homarus americanus]